MPEQHVFLVGARQAATVDEASMATVAAAQGGQVRVSADVGA